MEGPKRRVISTPGSEVPLERRSPGTLLVSLVVHVLAILVLVQIAIVPRDWIALFGSREAAPREEHVTFLQPASGKAPTQRDGGDGRVLRDGSPSTAPATPPIVTPTTVPTALPPVPTESAPVRDQAGLGPIVGNGGEARGLRPSYSDPRVWAPPAVTPRMPLTKTQRMDSLFAAGVRKMEDSLDALPHEGKPGDWTFKRGDKVYGIDDRFIRLGNFKLPTALLALLPINAQANPTAVERDRRLGMIRQEIAEQAARIGRDDEFKAAVKALRDRNNAARAAKKSDLPVVPPDVRP
jgi:hypothetical protein